MSSVDYIKVTPDWRSEAIDLNLNQFLMSEKLNDLLGILSEIATSFEQDILDLNESFLLVNAEGDQLDKLGEEVGLARTSDIDQEYKSSIILKASSSFYSVVDADLTELITLLASDTEPEIYSGYYKLVEVHLQESCVRKDIISSTIKDILPIVSKDLLLFSAGIPFGFEGDDMSEGFGTVGQEDENTNGFAAIYI